MTVQVALHHVTHYRYDRRVQLGPQVIRLRPAPHCRTNIDSYSLSLGEGDHFLNWQQDAFGNFLARVIFPEPVRDLRVEVDVVASLVAINPFDFFVESHAETYPFRYSAEESSDLEQYLETEALSPRLAALVDSIEPSEGQTSLDLLVAINARLCNEIRYLVRQEPGVQTPEETLELGSGSCRDSGWLLVHILRHLGIAARFASGYLIQLAADQKSLDGPSGPDEDFCDLHAWAEAYLPGAGWIGLDPTSGLLAGEGHLPLASTPTPRGAAPISGSLDDCETEFEVTMTVERVAETPRVTLPYSDETWARIEAAGEAVDRRLVASDVRLTMGGEPTFVSIDDQAGDEWNTAALGSDKERLGAQLLGRLHERLATGGAMQFGQGKWYPGEPLPRWAYALFWREDGLPLWSRPDKVGVDAIGAKATTELARSMIGAIARNLKVDESNVRPAYENPWHELAQSQTAPPSADEARRSAARKPVGYVLPVQVWQARDRRGWRSDRWRLRSEELYLVPGDSPIGFRLPLDAVELDEDEREGDLPIVPFERAEPLAKPEKLRTMYTAQSSQPTSGRPWPSRSALAVEPRNGHLNVFLPPVPAAEDYAGLLAAIEDAAVELDVPIRLEGYEPPPDHRIRVLKVTPDPGVIEVNVAPAASWSDLVRDTVTLYEEARSCRLSTEKFMQDGRHTGTGGGNHVVLGGATPADSPFLRRPDLLRSFLGCFINHPSLSFMFAGMFIGPTSQAPRVDQARNDALYELQIAFSQVPGRDDPDAGSRPWLVDRIFRDVLADVTGNTHRTEICIDKLYNPDSATGRLGLVEFRGFEMPPHARMSLAQGLLLRAMVAHFWDQPYEHELQNWGTALHDRFLLPHFVWSDFGDVIGMLARGGLEIDVDWFAPHFEFRFPVIGSVRHAGIELELRTALEPWHVTGEHGVAGGTARYVDSSLERLQVKVTGLVESRHVVCCNGRRVPLVPTGVAGEFVAGIRFRAWQPPQCLHPTIGIDAPLKFDIVDRWSGRSVAGCAYHVGHPGGRNPESFPINALEAEGRRIARFSTLEHTPGPFELRPEPVNPVYPATLDLRRR